MTLNAATSTDNVTSVAPEAAPPEMDSRRTAYRAVLDIMGTEHVAFWPGLVALLGSPSAAVLLSQLFYWTERLHQRPSAPDRRFANDDGWFYKSIPQLQKETAMGRREIEAARDKLLALGVLQSFVGGMPRVTYLKLDLDRLASILDIPPVPRREFSRDLLTRLLGRPYLMNRTLAKVTGGINPGLYLSYLIGETRRQLRENDGESSWLVKMPLADITEILHLTQRQTEYCRQQLRRLNLISEWRQGMPGRSHNKVNWRRLSGLLMDLTQQPTSQCPVDNLQNEPNKPLNSTECRIPALRKAGNLLSTLHKNAVLDFTKTPDKTSQKRPAQTAILSTPLTIKDYSYKPPPTSPCVTMLDSKEEEVSFGLLSKSIKTEPSVPATLHCVTTATSSVVTVPLVLSKLLPKHLEEPIRCTVRPLTHINCLTPISAQDVLDELVGRLRMTSMTPVNNPLGFLRRLVDKALANTLTLEWAYGERAKRETVSKLGVACTDIKLAPTVVRTAPEPETQQAPIPDSPLWQACSSALKQQFSPMVYRAWLSKVVGTQTSENVLTLHAPNISVMAWIKAKAEKSITSYLESIGADIKLHIVLKSSK
jgi:DnaA N-terminal domain